MKKLLSFMLLGAALNAAAYETSDINYSHATSGESTDLIWGFDTIVYEGQTCASITNVSHSKGLTVSGALEVPQSLIYNNAAYIVKRISAHAFRSQIGITSITIPSTVEEIYAPFCSGCTLLSSIEVDSGNPWYTSFNGMLFDKDRETLIACPATLDTIDLPSTVTTIGPYAFGGCFRVKTLSLPASVTTISAHAFDGCKKLTAVTFSGDEPDSVDATAFSDISATGYIPKDATWSVTPPADWKGLRLEYSSGAIVSGIASADSGNVTWYYRVVDGKAELYNNGQSCIGTGTSQTYTLDTESAKWIGDGELKIPSSLGGYPVTKIGDNAFRNCSALSTVAISESITDIGDYAFRNCSGIKSLTIPGSVKTIGSHPFEGTSMTALALPDSLRELDGNPMAGCDTMLSVTIASDNSYYTVANGLLYDKDVALLVGCPARQEGATLATTCTAIGPEAFHGCFRISSMIIPEYVATIGDSAFNNMSRLASLVFPASVTTLESAALFSGCTAITFVGFSGNAPAHDDDLFLGTPTDMKVYVSQGTKGWNGDTASTALPASGLWPVDGANGRTIENLDVSAEADLKEGDVFTLISTNGTSAIAWTLKVLANKGVKILAMSPKPTGDFTVPESFDCSLGTLTVKSVASKMLANSTGLLSVSFPNTVTNIGDEVFLNCDVLTDVSLNTGLRAIGRHAFSGTAIQTITIPDTVQNISGNILAGCNPSVSLSVSENNPYFSVSSEGALYDKDYTTLYAVPITVEELEIPATVTDFAEECFLGCLRLKKVSFLGDAPTAADGDDLYLDVHASMTNFVSAGNTTFGTLPGTWHLRPVVSDGEVPVEDDGEFKYRIVNNSYAEIYNSGSAAIDPLTSGTITIPDTLGDYPVKKIGAGAFRDCVNITAVSIPATVTEIGDYAFYGCEMLEAIELPSALTTLGKQPFYGTGLTALELPAKVQNLDGNPVAGCELLASITVADGSRYLVAEDGLLYNRKQTTLYACQAYAEEIAVPDTVTAIGTDALSCCYDLTNVTFSGNAPACDDDLYVDCEDVVSYVNEDATGFSSGTWKNRKIVATPLGTATQTIDGVAFTARLSGNRAVITSITDYASELTIPNYIDGKLVAGIDSRVLATLDGVTAFRSETPEIVAYNDCLYTPDRKTLIRVPDSYDFTRTVVVTNATYSQTTTYETASRDGDFMYINKIVSDTQSLVDRKTASTVCIGQHSLSDILENVSTVGDYAFANCTGYSDTRTCVTNSSSSSLSSRSENDTAYTRRTLTTSYSVITTNYVLLASWPATVTDIAATAFEGSTLDVGFDNAENPTVNGESVPPAQIFSTATTAAPVTFTTPPVLSGTEGNQTLTVNGVTLAVPSYYTATLDAEGTTLSLALNANANPTTSAPVTSEDSLTFTLSDFEDNLYYYIATSETIDGCRECYSNWKSGAEMNSGETTIQLSLSAATGFIHTYVTDVKP